MKEKYADLCVLATSKKTLETAKSLGWDSICLAREFKDQNTFKNFTEEVGKPDTQEMKCYTAAIINENIAENAKSAVECADIIIVDARSEEACRQASESYDVDIIMGPEKYAENDMTDYKSAGLDHVMMKYMADRKISYAIRFSDILNSYGSKRIQLLARIRQNIQLASKYKANVIAVSGATNEYELRAPREIAAYLSLLGLGDNAEKTLSENPEKTLKKTHDRKNPDIITEGVQVKNWGKQQKNPKRRHGWY